MRPSQNKRMRGGRSNNNRKAPNPLTRSYESNGPDVKIRGTAHHIGEKYLQLARDAQSSGDPVMAESYLQHAEHYFRLIAAAQQAQQQAAMGYRQGAEDDEEDDDDDFGGLPDRFASPPERFAPPQQQQQAYAQPGNGPQPSYPEQRTYNNYNNGNGGERQFEPREQRQPRNNYQDRNNNYQDRNSYQDRHERQDRNSQDRSGSERYQDRTQQDRSQQDRQPYAERQNRDPDSRNNNRGRRDYREPREPREPRGGNVMQDGENALPAFITAPVRIQAEPVETAAPAEIQRSMASQGEAEGDAFLLRPRRRRRTKAEMEEFRNEQAAASDPVGE